MKVEKKPLVADRVRTIKGGFSFIPHAFLTREFVTRLTQHELLLYFMLIVVGDRHGLSYYSQEKLCLLLRMGIDDLILARNGLIHKSLIAFDGCLFQVLSLPEKPVDKPLRPLTCENDFERDDPLTIRQMIRSSLDSSQRGGLTHDYQT
jgi:hypothetical protein